MKTYIFDACALLALLKQEKGYEIIEQLYEQAKNNHVCLVIHKINLLEIYYNICRESNETIADVIYDQIERSPIKIIDSMDKATIFKLTSYFKVKYKLGLGDSFLLATAKIQEKPIVVTADKGLKTVEENNEIEMLWIR